MKMVSASQQKDALLQRKRSAEDWKRGWKEREMTTERKDQERSRKAALIWTGKRDQIGTFATSGICG